MFAFGSRYFGRQDDDAVRQAQSILAGKLDEMSNQLVDAIDTIVTSEEHLSRKSSTGTPFSSFAGFAVAKSPHGLGVNDLPSFRLLAFALRDLEHYGPLVEVAEACARERGRPSNNVAAGENYQFLKIPTSYNSLLRILVTLKRRHPDIFTRVCAGELTPREAARLAEFLPTDNRASGVVNISAAAHLGARAQQNLVVKVWDALTLDAQCALIARRIEPRLGPEMAKQWRALGPEPRSG